jgi:ribosomal protein S18 acetylase RimI-like enzyme
LTIRLSQLAPSSDIHNEIERVRAFVESHQGSSADTRVDWPFGSAFFNDKLPRVYDLNFALVDHLDRGTTAEQIAAEAEQLMGPRGLDHRNIAVHDPALGKQLFDGFKDLGWRADRHAVMVHRREPDRVMDSQAVVESDEEKVWPARAEYLRAYEWCRDAETLDQMLEAYRIWMRVGNGRDFTLSQGGSVVSFAMLWSQGLTAQIEDVATLPNSRNRGLSRRVVARALSEARASGHDLVFLIADANDWPKELYRKLGFDELTSYFYYLKTPS